MEAKEYYEQILKRQLSYLHIDEYHKSGYKGKGITIVNAEDYPGNDGHGEMTTGVIKDYAPEANVINSQLKGSGRNRFLVINRDQIELEQAIREYNIKLVTSSKATSGDDVTLKYYKELQQKYGLIFFCAAGNYADEGVRSKWAKNDTAIAVGACQIKENGAVERMYYSSTGEELDFMCFMACGNGTSAASPALAAMTALLLQRYGDFNQQECVEILKSLCVDLGDAGRDNSHGNGLPVLSDKLEILDNLRGAEKGMTKDEFLNIIKDLAIKNMMNTGILASLTVAQAALESGWGLSGLTTKGNALFGIKANSAWRGKIYNGQTVEYYDGVNATNITAAFRAYDSWEDSIDDHSELLTGLQRYRAVVGEADYKTACKAVHAAGYATDPVYADKLINLIESYKLYEYDKEAIKNMEKIEELEKRVTALEQDYDTIGEVPDWAQVNVRRWMDEGIILGDGKELNLTLPMIRMLIMIERMLSSK